MVFWPGARWSNCTRRVADYVPAKSFRFDQTFRPKDEDTYNGPGAHLPQPGNPGGGSGLTVSRSASPA